jgi:hypothetical protein
MTSAPPHVIGVNEGMEAKRQGKPRQSPYATFHQAWLKGWDSAEVRDQQEIAENPAKANPSSKFDSSQAQSGLPGAFSEFSRG